MTTTAILREMEGLPLSEKLFIIERTLKSIRTADSKSLGRAVDSLYEDYKSNTELRAFSALDTEDF